MANQRQKMQTFLAQDRAKRMKENEAAERARQDMAAAVRKKEIDAENKMGEQNRLWKTFYDGQGYMMSMDFTWSFCHLYFVSPVDPEKNPDYKYNYVLSSSEYPNGNNTIRPFYGTIGDFYGDSFGRDKGKHIVKFFCKGVTFVADEYFNTNGNSKA